MIGVVLVAAVAIETEALRNLILVLLSGPLAWMVLQSLRRGRGIAIDTSGPERLTIQFNVRRRTRVIRFSEFQAYRLTERDQLALAYLQPRPADPGDEPRPPRLRLLLTAALSDPDALRNALPETHGLSAAQLDQMLMWRRVRHILYWLAGLFVGVPLLIVAIIRTVAALSVHGVG